MEFKLDLFVVLNIIRFQEAYLYFSANVQYEFLLYQDNKTVCSPHKICNFWMTYNSNNLFAYPCLPPFAKGELIRNMFDGSTIVQ